MKAKTPAVLNNPAVGLPVINHVPIPIKNASPVDCNIVPKLISPLSIFLTELYSAKIPVNAKVIPNPIFKAFPVFIIFDPFDKLFINDTIPNVVAPAPNAVSIIVKISTFPSSKCFTPLYNK